MQEFDQYEHIGFIGLGLIGGSIAKLIREIYPNIRISGFSRQKDTIDFALAKNIIDLGTTEKEEIPKDLDLVFICTPISHINEYVKFISNHIESDLVITDVGSIKTGIGINVHIRKNHIFIGGHPMAGSEKNRVQFSDAGMMKNATYILMKQLDDRYVRFCEFIKRMNFRVIELSEKEHDLLLTYASHLPYLMACLTVKSAEEADIDGSGLFDQIISRGFFDTTRVASSPVEWGVDVCKFNKQNLQEALEITKYQISILEKLIKTDNFEELNQFFLSIKAFRDQLYSK